MWRNCTVCLVGITLAGTGCIVNETHSPSGGYRGSSRDSGGGTAPSGPPVATGSGALGVRWGLAYLDGNPTDCQAADTPTVLLHATLSNGARYNASFPCTAGGGVATALPGGVYDLTLELLDAHDRPVSTVSRDDVPVFDGTTSEAGGVAVLAVQAWDLAWTIAIVHRNGASSPASCGDVGAASIRFVAQLGGESADVYELPCNDYSALSTAIRPGNYQVQMQLIDYQGRRLSETDPLAFPVTFDRPAMLGADFALY
jgi:hypothetical protein